MKIISAFRDYYDSVAAWDREADVVYMRSEQSWSRQEASSAYDRLYPHYALVAPLGIRGAVAFCGKLYPFWYINGHYCYTFPQIRKAVAEYLKEAPLHYNAKKMLAELDSEKVNLNNGYWGVMSRGTWDKWAELRSGVVSTDLFRKYGAPVLAAAHDHFITNPCLKRLNFHTVVDPYTAYQELSMFLGNELAQQVDPIPKTSDELKAHAHGFDKWSFRTHKADSKKARKRVAKEQARKEEVRFDDKDFKL